MYRFIIVGIIIVAFLTFTVSYQINTNKCEEQGRVSNSSWGTCK